MAVRDSLTIVIPALNEEDAIGLTVQRCLDVREQIKEAAGLDEIEIIVVSDGSTDRTVEIAQSFDQVHVIVFPVNKGYGAAIKEGFRQGKGTIVGFIDADGTCDPRYFAPMCRVLKEQNADIVLGSRMGPTSKMPAVRKLGNRIFALMLGILCGRHVTDTASGMRVIRRSALPELYPLTDRLHFTSSMSARALIHGMNVIEIPMHYEERIGTSKLSVLGDGVRFVKTIIAGVLCYRPERLFLMTANLCVVVAVVLGVMPTEYYLSNRSLQEWMIYRLVACCFLGMIAFQLLSATALTQQMAKLGPRRREGSAFWPLLVTQLFRGWGLGVLVAMAVLISLFLLWPGIYQYATTGRIVLHWSRVLVGTFGLLVVVQALVTYVLIRVLGVWIYQKSQGDTLDPVSAVDQPA